MSAQAAEAGVRSSKLRSSLRLKHIERLRTENRRTRKRSWSDADGEEAQAAAARARRRSTALACFSLSDTSRRKSLIQQVSSHITFTDFVHGEGSWFSQSSTCFGLLWPLS